MDPLSITASLIGVLQITAKVISICYDYRQGVKDASREVLQLSDELQALKDVLDGLLRLVESGKGGVVEGLVEDGGVLKRVEEEMERLQKRLEPENGWRRLRKSLVWPLKEGEIKKILATLERLKGTMTMALNVDQTFLTISIKKDVGDLTKLIQRQELDQLGHAVYTWLNAPDPHGNHAVNQKKCQTNTGNWFIYGKQFEDFVYSSNSVFWVYGIPGSGKSVLCSTIIEHLADLCQMTPQTALMYFYFDFNDSEKRDVNSLIKSLITQLSLQCTKLPPPLLDLYREYQSGRKAPEESSLIATLRNLLLLFHEVYIVIDALDESGECDEVLQLLTLIYSWNNTPLHLLLTSRQLPQIEEVMAELSTSKICLQDSRMGEDIAIYIADKLEHDKTLAKWPTEIRQQIKTKLLTEQDGMFQWVVCQLDMLKTCMSVAALRLRMNSLAKSLDGVYDQILLGIDEWHQLDVVKTLQAVMVAEYPLTLEEIVEIIAVDLESDPALFDPDNRIFDPRGILTMCSSLVTNGRPIFKGSSWRTHDGPTHAVRLAHASVADYLHKPRINSSLSKFHFSSLEARQFFAQTCLIYLSNPEFAGGHDDLLARRRLQEYPFLSHATVHWPKYLKRHPGDPEDYIAPKTLQILQEFFASSKKAKGGSFSSWVGFLIPSAPATFIQTTQPLYYAASYGLIEVVKIILQTTKDLDIDALGGRATASALHVAVYRDHLEVAAILLERGADANLVNIGNESPLDWARSNGNVEMQELLCKYGAVNRL